MTTSDLVITKTILALKGHYFDSQPAFPICFLENACNKMKDSYDSYNIPPITHCFGVSHLKEGPVVTLIQCSEKRAQMRDSINSCQNFRGIHDLLFQRDSIQCDQTCDNCVEYALLVGE